MPYNKMLILLIPHLYEAGKLLVIAVLAAAFATSLDILEGVGEHPAITSILAGGTVALAIKFIDKYLDGRNKGVKTADKVLELEQQERKELRASHLLLMEEQKTWWHGQNTRLRAEIFDIWTRARRDRIRAEKTNHAAINEIMRLQHLVLGMQRTLIIPCQR